MSKTLSISVVVLALLASACEPVTTSIVELPGREASTPVVEDARAANVERDSTTSVPLDEEEACVGLLDQTLPIAKVPEDPVVLALTSEAAGCGDADAGPVFLHASVFSRRDAGALVERGKTYSYRWPSSVAMTRVNLRGGSKACADDKVVFAEGSFALAKKGVASCYEFTAPITARYLRTTAADYLDPFALIGLTVPPRLQLCAKPCPEGTQPPPPTDAGLDATIPSYDAALPTWP